jgi:hypothetical protein
MVLPAFFKATLSLIKKKVHAIEALGGRGV